MGSSERKESRRRSSRFAVAAPAWIWPEEGKGLRKVRSHTRDISRNGLWLQGDFNQPVGAYLRFEVQLPAPIEGKTSCILCGVAKLVRYEVQDDQRTGFGAEIKQYKMLPLEQTHG